MSYSNLENIKKNENEKYPNSKNKQMITKETYLKTKFLGEGTFGVVYLIKSNLTNIEYVWKDIDLTRFPPEQEKKTLAEVSVLKKCKHPNIILFKEAFITKKPKKELHLILEYADSGDLDQQLNKQKKKKEYFKENLIINWLVQTCLGLKHIHYLHVIHRDIKPQNIFLTKNGIIKIGDFGISKVLEKNEKDTSTCIGTPLYMPPEIINHQKYDYKVDVWSLGVTFFELINFYRPYGGNHTIGVFTNIVEGKNQIRMSKNNNNYSQELINIINKMISMNPNQRPTIDEILNVPIINKHLKEFLQKNKKLYEGIDLHLSDSHYVKINPIKNKSICGVLQYKNKNTNSSLNTINEVNETNNDIKNLTQENYINDNVNNIDDDRISKTQKNISDYRLEYDNY
jgi:NIMA (never in mitosis gene a)-related kinase